MWRTSSPDLLLGSFVKRFVKILFYKGFLRSKTRFQSLTLRMHVKQQLA